MGLEPTTGFPAPHFQSDAICEKTREKTPVSDSCQQIASSVQELSPDLQAVIASWPTLSEAIKAGILAHMSGSPPAVSVEFARKVVSLGAGEILLTSIDQDGARTGYDLDLCRAVAGRVTVPLIASGGAGTAEHMRDGLTVGGADAVLLAGILHDGLTTVSALKSSLSAWGVPVRGAP